MTTKAWLLRELQRDIDAAKVLDWPARTSREVYFPMKQREKPGVATGHHGARMMRAPRDSKPRERLLWESPTRGQPGDFRSCLVRSNPANSQGPCTRTAPAGRSATFCTDSISADGAGEAPRT
jgi:hypothetical protein